jgi:hypothetical protein
MGSPILTIDVAHPPRKPDVVEQELLNAWSQVRNSSSYRILKIIHGGSSTKRGVTRDVVRNWAFRTRSKFRNVINGEDYSVYQQGIQEMRKEVDSYSDPDLDSGNEGIIVVWVK